MIKYKTEWYGKEFIQIDRFYPSTKKCHKCGYRNITLNIRQGTCSICQTKHDRNINAAKNILQEATKNKNHIYEPVGQPEIS